MIDNEQYSKAASVGAVMSAANNTSKSGNKFTGSPDEFYDDEIVNWLQCPLGDSMEKGYCSELFGQWPFGSASTAKQPAAVGSSKSTPAGLVGMGSCTYSEMGSLWRPDSASASMGVNTCNVMERGGCSPSLSRAASADGALALGAERAAGLASQNGRDEFSKVRTSMQRPAGSHISPFSPALNSVSASDHSFPSGTIGLLTGKLSPAVQRGASSPSKLPHGIPSYGTTVSSGLASISGKGTTSSSGCFTAFKPKISAEAPLQMPNAQESGCSRVTDEVSVKRHPDYVSSASSLGQPSTGQSAAVIPTQFAALAVDAHAERIAIHAMPNMALAATSGRSLSGTTLSAREASSNSGKRKLDDSESQSEDVEGESSFDIRRPRKPSSKRNRAAEVHNLSERNRRNRINEKLKTLQDLIPNSSKTDKASVLDEAIEYMKSLQMQLQMVSMRSGLSVSPMMIPLGMPHLQMAPLHPVGLGVPVGHPGLGMGMGLHMSMGMGMVDLHQGMPQRPHQPVSVSPNLFSIPPQLRGSTGLQECSVDTTSAGSIPSQLMPLSHGSSQVHPVSNSFPNVHVRQQQDQWQYTGQYSEGREFFNEQVGKED